MATKFKSDLDMLPWLDIPWRTIVKLEWSFSSHMWLDIINAWLRGLHFGQRKFWTCLWVCPGAKINHVNITSNPSDCITHHLSNAITK